MRNPLMWTLVFVFQVCRSEEDSRRPIWNVAHMVNALWQVDYYLNQGANSLEFDIQFNWEGQPLYTYHGIPCDCFRSCLRYEEFDTYINYLRTLTSPGDDHFRKELVLLFCDLKVSHLSPTSLMRAGENVATKLLELYWLRGKSGAQAYVLISLPSISCIEFARSFKKTMQEADQTFYNDKIGFDFSGNEDIPSMHTIINAIQLDDNIWLGDGITNCLPRSTSRLLEAIYRRDDTDTKLIDKVYWWTVDKMSTMRRVLSLGVDGMITNYPQRLVQVLKEGEFRKSVRLATVHDFPWKKYSRPTSRMMLLDSTNGTHLEFEQELLYNS